MTVDSRPTGAYVHGASGPVAVVTGRIAALLLARADIATLRLEARTEDPEVTAVLGALTYAANAYRTRTSATSALGGSEVDSQAEVAPRLQVMTTTEAAALLGITDRAIRLACAHGRLPAEQAGGRWQINRADVDNYRSIR